MGIHTQRYLTEEEVVGINYVTKRRAHRYIAAGEKGWLFPEAKLSSTDWKKLGNGWLFMPDPRCEHMGGEIVVGYNDGRAEAWNEYGQRPWQDGYQDDRRFNMENRTLERFQAEFAKMNGRQWRSVDADMGNWDYRHQSDSDDMFEHRMEIAAGHRRAHRKPRPTRFRSR